MKKIDYIFLFCFLVGLFFFHWLNNIPEPDRYDNLNWFDCEGNYTKENGGVIAFPPNGKFDINEINLAYECLENELSGYGTDAIYHDVTITKLKKLIIEKGVSCNLNNGVLHCYLD